MYPRPIMCTVFLTANHNVKRLSRWGRCCSSRNSTASAGKSHAPKPVSDFLLRLRSMSVGEFTGGPRQNGRALVRSFHINQAERRQSTPEKPWLVTRHVVRRQKRESVGPLIGNGRNAPAAMLRRRKVRLYQRKEWSGLEMWGT